MIRPLLGGLALVVVTAGLAAYGGSGAVRVWHMKREIDALERTIDELRTRTTELSRMVDRLRNDPLFIEKLAREELGYVREGDTVLKFPSPSPPR